ncbi:hypothetical protein KSF73_09795 [Burkholderiaceae bacterium DAT-1]|nr:hypothetical protein [Burkholderiaceae bacterium DAT-1]
MTKSLVDHAVEQLARHWAVPFLPGQSHFDVAMRYALEQFETTLRGTAYQADETSKIVVPLDIGEEERTASLIGFLSSSLSTFHLLGALGGQDANLAELKWGIQGKAAESRSGGDFGLAVEFEGPDAQVYFALAFFQAKSLDSKGMLDVGRAASAYRRDGADLGLRNRANCQLYEFLTAPEKMQDKMPIPGGFQLLNLIFTQNDGQVASGSDANWVHYVGWDKVNGNALYVPLKTVVSKLRQKFATADPKFPAAGNKWCSDWPGGKLNLGDELGSLHDLLRIEHICAGKNWLHVNAPTAETLIGELMKLGQRWYFAGRAGADGLAANLAARNDTVFKAPTAPAIEAAQANAYEAAKTLDNTQSTSPSMP